MNLLSHCPPQMLSSTEAVSTRGHNDANLSNSVGGLEEIGTEGAYVRLTGTHSNSGSSQEKERRCSLLIRYPVKQAVQFFAVGCCKQHTHK